MGLSIVQPVVCPSQFDAKNDIVPPDNRFVTPMLRHVKKQKGIFFWLNLQDDNFLTGDFGCKRVLLLPNLPVESAASYISKQNERHLFSLLAAYGRYYGMYVGGFLGQDIMQSRFREPGAQPDEDRSVAPPLLPIWQLFKVCLSI